MPMQHTAATGASGLLIYGGIAFGHSMGLVDVHLLRLPSLSERSESPWQWEQPVVQGGGASRRGHSVTPFGGKLLVYGGTTEATQGDHEERSPPTGDLAVLDPLRGVWETPTALGPPPMPRKAHDTRCVGGRIFVSGGITEGDTQLNRKKDVHELIVLPCGGAAGGQC